MIRGKQEGNPNQQERRRRDHHEGFYQEGPLPLLLTHEEPDSLPVERPGRHHCIPPFRILQVGRGVAAEEEHQNVARPNAYRAPRGSRLPSPQTNFSTTAASLGRHGRRAWLGMPAALFRTKRKPLNDKRKNRRSRVL